MCCLVEELLVRLDTTDLGVIVCLSVFVESVLQPGQKETETPDLAASKWPMTPYRIYTQIYCVSLLKVLQYEAFKYCVPMSHNDGFSFFFHMIPYYLTHIFDIFSLYPQCRKCSQDE